MLEQLGSIGISWRQGGASSIARFTLPEARAAADLRAFAEQMQLAELGYLATCNRIELIFMRSADTPLRDLRAPAFRLLSGVEPQPGEAERTLKAWEGEGAAEHLFLVAAGLDSACVGETEISGQVRRCYDQAQQNALAGSGLRIVFEEAQRIAGQVRGGTRLGEGRVSLAEIAVQELLAHTSKVPGPIALIGVSAMTERAARSLVDAGQELIFVNRTAARAESLAARYHARHASLDSFRTRVPAIAGLLAATGSPDPVLDAATLTRVAEQAESRHALLIDMAIPPDIDPRACQVLGLTRIGMDDINAIAQANRAARLLESASAREQVDEALGKLQNRFAEAHFGPLLGALQNRYQRTAREGLERLLRKELAGLGSAERAAMEAWCHALARRFAHIPCMGLRGLVRHGPDGSLDAFISALEPEFAAELRQALEQRAAPAADADMKVMTMATPLPAELEEMS